MQILAQAARRRAEDDGKIIELDDSDEDAAAAAPPPKKKKFPPPPCVCVELSSQHPHLCRADLPKMGHSDAAAATWIFRGDESRRVGDAAAAT